MDTDIIEFEIGLQVAVRSGYTSWYGVFTGVTPTTCTVRLQNGVVMRFVRASRFQIGSQESRYTRPYLTTVAKALAKDAEYRLATLRAGASRVLGL
jgi:hypothetical protein